MGGPAGPVGGPMSGPVGGRGRGTGGCARARNRRVCAGAEADTAAGAARCDGRYAARPRRAAAGATRTSARQRIASAHVHYEWPVVSTRVARADPPLVDR
ncbi:hypothetical protein DNK48_24765 [Streptomyces malaysiensis subsp. malaysiensis]|nr:hypothetical protein DNK48_24765 [Streptomyces malaysiensis]